MGKIVITGATSDIGWAITKRVALLGKPMLLQGTGKVIPKLEDLKTEARFVSVDFSSSTDLDMFIAELQDVDILINAAACTITELLPQMDVSSIEKMIAVNILAPIKICKAVIPQMLTKRDGVIINISSVTASKVYRGQSVYGGSKAFIEAFTKGIAAEYGSKGIRCNSVAPGNINSGKLKILLSIAPEKVAESNAMKKFGEPKDVANLVEFLCKKESSFINGTTIHLDGGHWLGV